MKYTSFDYGYFWHIVPLFNSDAFGFWKFWYAEAIETFDIPFLTAWHLNTFQKETVANKPATENQP